MIKKLSVDEVKDWLAIRKAEGLKIDPETAVVFRTCGYIIDPYHIRPELWEEYGCIGKIFFARAPGSEISVCFYDLPKSTRDALWERIQRGLYEDPFCQGPRMEVGLRP